MKRLKKNNKGFTLAETMVAVLFLTAVWVATMGSLVTNKYIASYSKHKVQAIFAAQSIMEEVHRWPFANIIDFDRPGISLDTRGTFNTAADDMMADAHVRVTILAPNRRRVQVEVVWQEHSAIASQQYHEFLTTTMVNESLLN